MRNIAPQFQPHRPFPEINVRQPNPAELCRTDVEVYNLPTMKPRIEPLLPSLLPDVELPVSLSKRYVDTAPSVGFIQSDPSCHFGNIGGNPLLHEPEPEPLWKKNLDYPLLSVVPKYDYPIITPFVIDMDCSSGLFPKNKIWNHILCEFVDD